MNVFDLNLLKNCNIILGTFSLYSVNKLSCKQIKCLSYYLKKIRPPTWFLSLPSRRHFLVDIGFWKVTSICVAFNVFSIIGVRYSSSLSLQVFVDLSSLFQVDKYFICGHLQRPLWTFFELEFSLLTHFSRMWLPI